MFLRGVGLFLLLVLFWPAGPGLAGERVVLATGRAPIIHGDLAQAEEEALAEARLRAVEEAAGVFIEAETYLANELLLASSLKTRARGVILSEDVLGRGPTPEGLYQVQLRARVADDALRDELIRLLREDAILIVTQESLAGRPMDSPILEPELARALTRRGYRHLIGSLTAERHRLSPIQAADCDPKQIEDWSLRYLADVVMVGQVSAAPSRRFNGLLHSARAEGWFKVFLVREGRVLAEASAQAVRGFGNSFPQACQDAAAKAARLMTGQVMGAITPRDYRTLKVVFHHIPSHARSLYYARLLKAMRWVEAVEQDSYHFNKTTYTLKYGHKPGFLAARLALFPGLDVLGFDNQCLKVEVKRDEKIKSGPRLGLKAASRE